MSTLEQLKKITKLRLPQKLKTALFAFINLFSILNYIVLIDKVADINQYLCENSYIGADMLDLIYISIMACIGIRIFSFFIVRDLNELFLHRLRYTGSTHSNLRALKILIVIEMVVFGMYMLYQSFPYYLSKNDYVNALLFVLGTSYALNFSNLALIHSVRL